MKIEGTKGSPTVNLSDKTCQFEISGSAYSESVDKIFDNIIDWSKKEIPKMSCELICVFKLYVISSIAQKKILYLVSKLNDLYKEGKKIKINWFVFDDEDNLEFAQEMSDLFNIPVKIIEEFE